MGRGQCLPAVGAAPALAGDRIGGLMELADGIGWGASAILLATLARQILVQWRERSTEGVSSLLFVGQLSASLGFTVYSWMLQNWSRLKQE